MSIECLGAGTTHGAAQAPGPNGWVVASSACGSPAGLAHVAFVYAFAHVTCGSVIKIVILIYGSAGF